jgi:hypothetical protein
MNATEAITKIRTLLGLEFRAEKFTSTKLIDGKTEVTNNKEEELQIGDTLYVVGETTLTPAPEGEHITREGLVVEVDSESIIISMEMEDVEESETEESDESVDMMSSATLPDGTKIETDEDEPFAVGQQLYFITESGERVSAPEGEHTTESGITIVTDEDGIITGVKYPDESGDGSLESMKRNMEKMSRALHQMTSVMESMNGKFKAELTNLKKEVAEFKKSPDRQPVVKKNLATKSDLLDWKIELIRNSKK